MIVAGAIWMFSTSYGEPGLAVLSLAIFTSTLGPFHAELPTGANLHGGCGRLHAWFSTRRLPHHTSSPTPRDFALGHIAGNFLANCRYGAQHR